ncbi:MAG: hypothetical protein EBT39_06430, partial [Sphingobacteriia bacterium]|nr:hypothetical protein [Candidatus Fonsibacter lacus]
PFEAVNLNAVDIKIKKIYEKNILQFFQINAMSGSNELNRVGKIIYKQRVSLTSLGELSQNNWQKYSIDLSKLIKTEPGAIYNVTLSFKKDYSIYNCNGDTSTTNLEYNYSNNSSSKDDESNTITENEDDWDNYNEYEEDYDYEERYDYSQRENPCSPSYYVYGKSISKNVLATNTSILAKRGNNGSITVMAADIISAQPIGNVELEVYDFQQTLIEKALTDISGIAQFNFKSKPFAIIAKNGKERTYLKLDDGSSLSLSMFDVEGEQIKKGLKGFIYGERGIWRPGDSLYLTFILENREKKIPAIFPVNMEIINPQGQVIQKITRTKNLDGFYNFSTKTETYAQTGTYIARIKAGGAVFTKNLRIETIMPNRLKLSLDFK